MNANRKGLTASFVAIFAALFSLAAYFTFAAVQGEYGLFRRIEVRSQEAELTRQLALLSTQVAALENKTHRMSDRFLDLDLLDEQARKVLGLARGDEIVIR
ncbi:MAG: septum formation initiator family protein [Paracoccaceae bacterium]